MYSNVFIIYLCFSVSLRIGCFTSSSHGVESAVACELFRVVDLPWHSSTETAASYH